MQIVKTNLLQEVFFSYLCKIFRFVFEKKHCCCVIIKTSSDIKHWCQLILIMCTSWMVWFYDQVLYCWMLASFPTHWVLVTLGCHRHASASTWFWWRRSWHVRRSCEVCLVTMVPSRRSSSTSPKATSRKPGVTHKTCVKRCNGSLSSHHLLRTSLLQKNPLRVVKGFVRLPWTVSFWP